MICDITTPCASPSIGSKPWSCYVPVQRLEVLIRRRKGERAICLDWHPLVRAAEASPRDWGLGLKSTRMICDERLHLTEPRGPGSLSWLRQALLPRLPPGRLSEMRYDGER